MAPAWVVVAAAVDLGEAKDVVEARKRCVDVMARDLTGVVVNVRAAGTQTPTSGQFPPGNSATWTIVGGQEPIHTLAPTEAEERAFPMLLRVGTIYVEAFSPLSASTTPFGLRCWRRLW